MVAQLVSDLELPLARVRLSSYRPAGGTDEDMIVNYMWNMALCEALYPFLNALEVSLRNGTHQAATNRYRNEFWFDLPGVLKYRQPGQIQAARDEMSKQSKPHTAGRIIAELRFSFWTSLLSGPYHSSFWMDRGAVILTHAFPHIPVPKRLRKDIHTHYNNLRFLRNRVFHYEPVWNRHDLAGEHDRIIEAIGWVSPALANLLTRSDRFTEVMRNGRADAGATLRDYLAAVQRP